MRGNRPVLCGSISCCEFQQLLIPGKQVERCLGWRLIRLADLTRNKTDAFPSWVAPLRLEPTHVARTDMKLNAHRELKVINLEDSGFCRILFNEGLP
jgi:hypothetical protein